MRHRDWRRNALVALAVLVPAEATPVAGGPGSTAREPRGGFVEATPAHWVGREELAGIVAAPGQLSIDGRPRLLLAPATAQVEGVGPQDRAENRRTPSGWCRSVWQSGLRWTGLAPGVQLLVLAPAEGEAQPRIQLLLAPGASLPAGRLRLAPGTRLASSLAWREAPAGRELLGELGLRAGPGGWLCVDAPAAAGGAPVRLRLELAPALSPAGPVALVARGRPSAVAAGAGW